MPPAHADFDYADLGEAYRTVRRADPRIAAQIHAALGVAATVMNVGAGMGSYEPTDRPVVAIEPARDMRRRRPAHLVPAINATAQSLPLDDNAVDAAMAILSVHHWRDLETGLAEMRRVARGPVVVLTFDPVALDRWWLAELCPEVIAVERRRYPQLDRLAAGLGGTVRTQVVPIPADCSDGFSEAFFARPEAFLEDHVLAAQSAWGFVDAGVREAFQRRLADDLASGVWDARFGAWRTRPTFEVAVRLLVATP